MTLVTFVVTSLWALSEFGIAAAVIQRPELDTKFAHTAWHMSWARGALLTLCCWSLAPVAASFFERPDLLPLLRWAAVIPLIHGLESLGGTLLQRELDFKRRSVIDLCKEGMNTIVAVLLAYYWQADVRALLWGVICGSLASTLVSYLVHSYRPKMEFHVQSCRDIWRYGGHLLGAGILLFAITNLDNVAVAKLAGVEQLGHYAVAFMLAGLLTNQLVQAFNRVIFPALSEIQHDDERLRRALCYSMRTMVGVLTPVVCLVALIPEFTIGVILGEHWLPAVPALLVLLAMGWVRGIASVFGPLLWARGCTAAVHRMKWIEFVLFAVCIVPAVLYWGIVGAALTLLAVYLLSLVLNVQAVTAELHHVIQRVFWDGVNGVLPGLCAFIVSWGLLAGVAGRFMYWELAVAVCFSFVWLCTFYWRERHFVQDLWLLSKPS